MRGAQITGNPASLDNRAILAEVERIVRSKAFGQSGRQKRLLRFLVERTLNGEAESLKEVSVAIDFFGRDAGYDSRTDPVVRVEVRRLRARLEGYYQSEGRNDAVRISIPKGGYIPAFEQRETVEPPADELRPISEPPVKHPSRRWAAMAGVALVLALVALGYWRFSSAAGKPPRSLAVLPFLPLAADAESQYFSEGLSDALTDALGKLDGLRVVAWTSAIQFQGKHEDVRSIGKKLDVEAVLEGSVQKLGGNVRVIARLDRVKDATALWSDTFEGDSSDLLAIQRQIARSIAGALRTKFNRSTAIEETPAPKNEAAYQAYLTGRYLWNRPTGDSVHKSILYFRQAVEKDPGYAPAYAGLADSLAMLPDYDGRVDPNLVAEGKQAALKALQLSPSLSEPKLTLAWIAYNYDWNWAAAERGFQEVIAQNSNNALAHRRFARALVSHSKFDQAERELRIARRLDPMLTTVRVNQAELAYYRRDFAGEERILREILALHPNYSLAHNLLTWSLILQKRFVAAESELETYIALPDSDPVPGLIRGTLHAALGKQAEARRELNPSLEKNDPTPETAALWLLLGDKERAITALERAFQHHVTTLMDLNVDPIWDPVRDDPRVQTILRKLGLVR